MRPALCVLTAAVVLLTGCTGTDDGGQDAAAESSSPSESPAPDESAADGSASPSESPSPPSLAGSVGSATPGTPSDEPSGPDDAADEPEDDESPLPGGTPPEDDGGCRLTGVWDLRDQPFLDQISVQSGAPGQATHGGGSLLLELRRGTEMVTTRNNWVINTSTAQGTLSATIDGTESGTWRAVDGVMHITVTDSSASVQLRVNGQPVPGGAGTFDAPGVGGSGAYSCTGDVLQVQFQGVTSTFDRVG